MKILIADNTYVTPSAIILGEEIIAGNSVLDDAPAEAKAEVETYILTKESEAL